MSFHSPSHPFPVSLLVIWFAVDNKTEGEETKRRFKYECDWYFLWQSKEPLLFLSFLLMSSCSLCHRQKQQWHEQRHWQPQVSFSAALEMNKRKETGHRLLWSWQGQKKRKGSSKWKPRQTWSQKERKQRKNRQGLDSSFSTLWFSSLFRGKYTRL